MYPRLVAFRRLCVRARKPAVRGTEGKFWGRTLGWSKRQHAIFQSVRRSTTHLRLAIDVGSDPITGRMSDGDDRWQPFTGWIDLVAAIEAARIAHPETDAAPAGMEDRVKTLGSFPGAKDSEP
jgi:hypothetical protein